MEPIPLSALAVSGYLVSPPQFMLEDRRGGTEQNSTPRKLARLTEGVARGRAALAEQSERFDALYSEAAVTLSGADELEQLAEAVLVNEHRVAATFLPKVQGLRRRLSEHKARDDRPDIRTWRRAAEEMIEMSITWLELYQDLRIRLHKLASDRRSQSEDGSPIFAEGDTASEYLQKLIIE